MRICACGSAISESRNDVECLRCLDASIKSGAVGKYRSTTLGKRTVREQDQPVQYLSGMRSKAAAFIILDEKSGLVLGKV